MSETQRATSGLQNRSERSGRRGSTIQHGGATTNTQTWDLETDFQGEGSGFQRQRQRHKRKRHSTGGTVSHAIPEQSQTLRNPDPSHNQYETLSADDKLSLILTKLATNETHMSTLQDKFDTAFGKGGQLSRLEDTVHAQSDRLTTLEYRSIDMEARSRRNNLLFKGLVEGKKENCAQTIIDFIRTHLKINEEIPIQRVHRLGKIQNDRNRFIIVAFQNFTDTEHILSQATKLKGTNFAISRDFPAEIVDARKVLWPEYRELRSKNPRAKIYIVYPAKLVHNGRTVRDMFPEWDQIMRRNRAKPDDRTSNRTAAPQPRTAAPQDQLHTASKVLHVSVYEHSTETSPIPSDSESDSVAQSDNISQSDHHMSDQDSLIHSTQKNTEPLFSSSQTPTPQTSSQTKTQPNTVAHSTTSPDEPTSPSIIRGDRSDQRDPDPPPVYSAPVVNA